MTDYRTELQAFVDAAVSFTEPALGHHKAWAEAVARARAVLSVPESSAKTACSITPPPELVEQWRTKPEFAEPGHTTMVSTTQSRLRDIATQAARWGANQELEACIQWIQLHFDGMRGWCDDLRAARRPEPPSLKEQALEALKHAEEGWRPVPDDCALIRRALESLPS